MREREPLRLLGLLVAWVLVVGASHARAIEPGALPDYLTEVDLLVDTPGTSSSVAAGLFNPAAWHVQRHGGVFLSWGEANGRLDNRDLSAALSLRALGFGMRSFHVEDVPGRRRQVNDYTLGIACGTRGNAWGVSYSWAGGDLETLPRHQRLTLGSVSRVRVASLGMASTWDLERRDNLLQADLGLRPLGPRLTLFGDAVYRHGQRFADIRGGYGLEARLLPGLTLAAKARSRGEFSLRVDVGLAPGLGASFRPHMDEGGDRVGSTYALELGPPRPSLGHGAVGRGRSYPEMRLKGGLAYQRYRLFDRRPTLLGTLGAIAAAAENPLVGGLVVNLSGLEASPEMQWEIRGQLAGLRARGKKVIVYVDECSMFPYMLASVADQIWMDPAGGLDIRGLNMGRTYMRHALDKLGLGVEEWRFFTYKSAFESYARDSMSEPDREQRQALVDDMYDAAAQAVSSGRGLARSKWDELVNDKGIFLPREAQAAGLVDSVGGFEQAKKSAAKAARRAAVERSATTLEGLTGDPLWGGDEWGEPGRIAVFYAIGECAMDNGIRGRLLSDEIRKARQDRGVKAVVLRADSPGGEALPSDLVARELRATAKVKPVIVSQGQVAASGGYWISMYADTIVASPLTITGSIGVIGGWIWDKGLGDKVGLTYDNVKRGEHADFGEGIRLPLLGETVPRRPPTPAEHQRIEGLIRTVYKDFVAQVAEGRELRPAYVDSIGQGRVWSGTRGRELGLVDEMGGLWRSLQIAKAAAHIPAARPVRIDEGPGVGVIDLGVLRPRLIGARAPEETVAPCDPAAAGLLTPLESSFLRHLARNPGRPLPILEPLEIQDGGPRPR